MPLEIAKIFIDEDQVLSDHYYQNQEFGRNIKESKNITQAKMNDEMINNKMTPHIYYNRFTPNPKQISKSTSGLLSSTISSEKPLVVYDKSYDTSYCFLVFSIFCILSSLISIAITFIFPFWVRLSIDLNNSSYINDSSPLVNITNIENHVSLIIRNNLKQNSLVIDIGIWEVKMNQELEIHDSVSPLIVYKNNFPQSKLWLNADINNIIESFLIKFLTFINWKNSYLFCWQILEIIHLIFTFLTFCLTSFTLCLCTNHKSSLCWYLVSFFICLISHLTGLSVIIIMIYCQMNNAPYLVDNQMNKQILVKTYNWCFWAAVGINSSLMFACFLILLYILIATFYLYRKNKYIKKKTKSIKGNSEINDTNDQINFNESLGNDFSQNKNSSRLPRLQTNYIVDSPAIMHNSRASTALAPNYEKSFQLDTNSLKPSLNSSYVFYSGHGQYKTYKNFANDEKTSDFIKSPNHNQDLPNLISDHQYSNVADQINNNDFKYLGYR